MVPKSSLRRYQVLGYPREDQRPGTGTPLALSGTGPAEWDGIQWAMCLEPWPGT